MFVRGLAIFALTLACSVARADFLGLYVGVGYWQYDMEGTLQMIANKLSQISWRMIKERIYDIIGDVIRKWDPSNMNLELELYVPTDFMW